jgi:hypothetical protein
VKALNDACVPVAYVTSYKNWPGTKVQSGKETVLRSAMFPRLTVEELQALRTSCPPPLAELKSFSTPAYLVLNPGKEKVGGVLDRKVSIESITIDLATAQKKLGTGAPVAAFREFDPLRAKFSAALDDDDFAKAVQADLALAKLKTLSDPMKKASDALRESLVRKGEAKIAEIEGYVDPAAVKEDLAKLADAFKGHALEKTIRERLKH